MSSVFYIASDKPLKERPNPHDKMVSVNEAMELGYLRANPFLLEFCDEEIESVRVKPVGEEGYVEPKVVYSARKRALEMEKQKKAQAQAAAARKMDKMTLKEADETKSKEQMAREMADRDNASIEILHRNNIM